MKIDELESIYCRAERYLQKLLLNGAPWNEVQTVMVLVTQLSIALHKNKYPLGGHTITSRSFRRK